MTKPKFEALLLSPEEPLIRLSLEEEKGVDYDLDSSSILSWFVSKAIPALERVVSEPTSRTKRIDSLSTLESILGKKSKKSPQNFFLVIFHIDFVK